MILGFILQGVGTRSDPALGGSPSEKKRFLHQLAVCYSKEVASYWFPYLHGYIAVVKLPLISFHIRMVTLQW